MSVRSGFIQLRRGIYEHVRNKQITWCDGWLYVHLLGLAHPGTGFAHTNVTRLAYETAKSPSFVQKYLKRLERKGYIKCFSVRGSRGDYPIALNKFFCTTLPMKELQLNADKTMDWRHPVYETVRGEVRAPVRSPVRGENSAITKERARGDFRDLETLEKTSKPKPRVPTPHAPPQPTARETEQRRKIEARDTRLDREAEVRREAMVGRGPKPEKDAVWVSCLQCGETLLEQQLKRCLDGKGPRGSQTYCPRNPKPERVTTPTAAGGDKNILHQAKGFA